MFWFSVGNFWLVNILIINFVSLLSFKQIHEASGLIICHLNQNWRCLNMALDQNISHTNFGEINCKPIVLTQV